MTHDETQQRLDALAEAMVEKGIVSPEATLMQAMTENLLAAPGVDA